MYSIIVSSLVVALISLLYLRYIERITERAYGGPLPRWRRLMIPLPILVMLTANLADVISSRIYARSHPGGGIMRDVNHQAWSTDGMLIAGMLGMAFLPFFLVDRPKRSFGFIAAVWGAHLLWTFIPFFPFLLASGVPLQD